MEFEITGFFLQISLNYGDLGASIVLMLVQIKMTVYMSCELLFNNWDI